MKRITTGLLIGVAAILVSAISAQALKRVDTTVRGVNVWRYEWTDSKNRLRTVSLKKQGFGNAGNGGYAVQATYQAIVGGVLRTIIVNAKSGLDGGFGYFVSHESYRTFTDGSEGTIASRVFNKDDSPLGRSFPVTGTLLSYANADLLAHRYRLNYPRYGTKERIPWDANGNPVRATPVAADQNQLYSLPITITWVFQRGKDHPRIQTSVSLSGVPKPDLVNFDIRGPYGVMDFDNGLNNRYEASCGGTAFTSKLLIAR